MGRANSAYWKPCEKICWFKTSKVAEVKTYFFQDSCHKPEYKYTPASELDGLPYTAKLDIYGGGGYIYRLNKPQVEIREDLLTLQRNHWINNHTRAMFLEFSVYNAQINLFGIVTIVAEFLPGGGIKPYWRIEPVRLLHHHESLGSFIMVHILNSTTFV